MDRILCLFVCMTCVLCKALHSVCLKRCPKRREKIWASLHTLWVVMPTQSDARKVGTGACRFTDARNVGATPARPRAMVSFFSRITVLFYFPWAQAQR